MIESCDTNLTEVNIPPFIEGLPVTEISNSAFDNCQIIEKITIPQTITKIGDLAFRWCPTLIEINVHADNTAYSSVDGILYNKNRTELIKYPACKEDNEFNFPSGITAISTYAFAVTKKSGNSFSS